MLGRTRAPPVSKNFLFIILIKVFNKKQASTKLIFFYMFLRRRIASQLLLDRAKWSNSMHLSSITQ